MNYIKKNNYIYKKTIMEIGQKVTWTLSNKVMLGLFMEEKDGMAEIMCYQMGDVNCRLRVCINIDLIKLA